jgi:hypothetical protein
LPKLRLEKYPELGFLKGLQLIIKKYSPLGIKAMLRVYIRKSAKNIAY